MEYKDVRDAVVIVFSFFTFIFSLVTMAMACEIRDKIDFINCINHDGKLYCEMK